MDVETVTSQDEPDTSLFRSHASIDVFVDRPSASVPANDREVKLVDAQISRYLGLVQELRSRRNTLVPISRLPTEILCNIFLSVRAYHEEKEPREDLAPVYAHPSLKWIAISQVSRHWRNAAINEPRLWTNPPPYNTMWTATMLERSQMASLPAITLDLAKDHPKSVIEIAQHLHRIKSFTICVSSSTLLRGLFKHCLPNSSPRLEALSLNFVKKESSGNGVWLSDDSSRLVDEFVELPDHLFAESHRLRRLQLCGIIPDWKSHLFSDSLQELRLAHIPLAARPSWAQFEILLKSAVTLKHLTLLEAFPPSPPNSARRTRFTPLPSLEVVITDSTILELIYLLETFSLPAIRHAAFVVEYEEQAATDFKHLCFLLKKSHLSQFIGSDGDIKRLELREYADGTLRICPEILDATSRRLHPYSRHTTQHLSIWVDVRATDETEEQIKELSIQAISTICKSFYPTGLSELEISRLNCMTPDALVSVFGSIPRLRVITTSKDGLIEALNQSASDNLSRRLNAGPIIFAELRHIGFAGADPGYPLSVKALQKCLEARRKLGVPIRSIELEGCDGLSQRAVDALKAEVEHLVWNTGDDVYSRYDLFD